LRLILEPLALSAFLAADHDGLVATWERDLGSLGDLKALGGGTVRGEKSL
jgi:hypothetical protein